MSDSPVMYRAHPKVPPGATCEGCGGAARVTDHCHAHGWVRGQVCTRCNGLMGIIDRRIAPKVEMALVDSLLGLWHRCPDCSRAGAIELGSGECEPSILGCSSAVRASDLHVNPRSTLAAVERGEHVQIKRYHENTAVIVPVDWYARACVALGEPEPTFEPADTKEN